MSEAIAYGTIVMTLGLVLWRPRIGSTARIGPGAAAALGVLVLFAVGIVRPPDLAGAVAALWRPFVVILSIMLTTNTAYRVGLFDHFAAWIGRALRGKPLGAVFRSVFIGSALTSAALNNDAAVLLLTPLIVRQIRRSYPGRPDLAVPFAFAVFAAAGVAPLVISNPMNLIVAAVAGIGFNEYAARMIPIAIVGWLATYALLRAIFAEELRAAPIAGDDRVTDVAALSPIEKKFLVLLAVAIGSYPVLSYLGGPLWAIAAGIAVVMMAASRYCHLASPKQIAGDLPWQILVFLLCVFVLVLGLRNVGLVGRVVDLYSSTTGIGQLVVIAVSSALGSAILNNHPMAILNALAIRELPQGGLAAVLAALIGGDLGPRLLPIGSLAGLLWIHLLARESVHIGVARFARIGLVLTAPTLALSLLLLIALTL